MAFLITNPVGTDVTYGWSKNGLVSGIEVTTNVPLLEDYNDEPLQKDKPYYVFFKYDFDSDFRAESVQTFIDKSGDGAEPGINAVLNVENKAVIELILNAGLQLQAGGDDANGNPVRFRLANLPAELSQGDYYVLGLHRTLKEVHGLSWALINNRLSGTTPEELPNPGPPVFPAYPDREYSSGADINIPLGRVTTAGGAPYPLAGVYSIIEGPSFLSLQLGALSLTGKYTTATRFRAPVTIQFQITEGPDNLKGNTYTNTFQLTVLAQEVTQFPQPTITQIAAISIVQGQTTPLQLQVTYPGGITKTGTFSASGLPSGLSINTTNGKFPGAPTIPGDYFVTVTFRDSDGQTDDMQFTMTVTANPVNTWLLGVFYWTDFNTGGADFGLRLASGTPTALVAVEALDSTVYTGNGANGSTIGTDPGGAGYWQSVVPSTGYSEFNVRAGFYPFSISPKIGGLATGKAYKVKIKRPGDSVSVDFYFYFNPVQNVPVSPMLTSPPEAGTGTNQLTPPPVGLQSLIAGTAVSKQFNDFTGWQSGETKTFTYSGIPAGVTFAYNTTSGKFEFSALTTGALDATIGVVATGSLGSYGSFSFQVTSTVALSSITTIYRKFFPSSGIGVGGVITSYGNVSFEAVVAGNQIVQVQANRSTLPTDNDWYDQTKNSAGRYGFTFGQLTGGETLTIKFRIKGQTAEIPLTYTVLSPLSNNSTAEIQVYPNGVPGNNLTPNRLLRVGQPDPQNPIFTPSLSWVTGFDGAQWLRVTATLASATYSWKVFLNGEPVTGFPIDLPQHTQVTIDVMDSNNYDPYASDIAKKAQLILYTGTPDGTTVTQNT